MAYFMTWQEMQELLDLIREIKKHDSPPVSPGKQLDCQYPWYLLGTVSSGICVAWEWFPDALILQRANKNDLLFALEQYKKKEDAQ